MALTNEACLFYLEELKWHGTPTCPYCGSTRSTPIPKEWRYHCNYCFTSYSVTVNTIFHRSHVSLSKWFKAIFLIESSQDTISVRSLAAQIAVTKNTASSLMRRIREAKQDNPQEISKIVEFYKKFVDESRRTRQDL